MGLRWQHRRAWLRAGRGGLALQVFDYKGVKNSRKFVPFSEYNQFRYGNGHSAYYNADILQSFRRHLDLPLETDLGYFYTDIFSRCGACAGGCGTQS